MARMPLSRSLRGAHAHTANAINFYCFLDVLTQLNSIELDYRKGYSASLWVFLQMLRRATRPRVRVSLCVCCVPRKYCVSRTILSSYMIRASRFKFSFMKFIAKLTLECTPSANCQTERSKKCEFMILYGSDTFHFKLELIFFTLTIFK